MEKRNSTLEKELIQLSKSHKNTPPELMNLLDGISVSDSHLLVGSKATLTNDYSLYDKGYEFIIDHIIINSDGAAFFNSEKVGFLTKDILVTELTNG